MATLNLPNDPRTLVWRVIRAALESDATLASSGIVLVFLDHTSDAIRSPSTQGRPCLRFVPTTSAQAWFDERSKSGRLVVLVEVFLEDIDLEDLMNVQGAIEKAIESNTSSSRRAALKAAGATDGLLIFDNPLAMFFGREGEDFKVRARGSFSVAVQTIGD